MWAYESEYPGIFRYPTPSGISNKQVTRMDTEAEYTGNIKSRRLLRGLFVDRNNLMRLEVIRSGLRPRWSLLISFLYLLSILTTVNLMLYPLICFSRRFDICEDF